MHTDDAEGRRSLRADGGNEVFQAGGDQYILGMPGERPRPARTLPRASTPLIGRDAETQALLTGHALYLIDGMPGVGKTALAVHTAHLLRERYPDAAFFIDLHAHTAGMRAVTPDDALYQLLAADGVAPGQIAHGTAARADQWRSRLAGRPCVIVLDNALDRRQVAPLLPAGGDSVVLVTSRRRLTGLIAQHAADPLELATLTESAAADLFARHSGRDPHAAESTAIAEIVRDCGTLPLAICLMAGQLRARPHRRAADLLSELRRAVHRTSRMCAEDLAVGPAFDLSFRRLPKPQRRFLRRLGMHPGADVDVPAAAALADVDPDTAEAYLEALVQEHLVLTGEHGRYQLHDLIGDYVKSRDAGRATAEAERIAALVRLADDYERRIRAADRALVVPYPPDREHLTARAQALAWLQQQRVNLLACAMELARTDRYEPMARLTAGLAPFLREAGPWEQAITLYRVAAECASRADAPTSYAAALRELGGVLYLRSEYEAAMAELDRALTALRADPGGAAPAEEAATLTRLVAARRQHGDLAGAHDHLDRALELCRAGGERVGEAEALVELGTVHLLCGRHDAAVGALREALAIHREHGSARACAETMNRLGAALQERGAYQEAIAVHEHALDLCRMLADRRGVGVGLNYVGHLYCQLGEYDRAAEALEEAREVHRRMASRSGLANCLVYLGRAYRGLDRRAEAQDVTRAALSIFRELGNQLGCANSLNQIGILHRLDGDRTRAAAAHREALQMFVRLDYPVGQADVLNSQGELDHQQGRTLPALQSHRRALDLAARAGSGTEQARAYEGIGRCLTTLGQADTGRESYRAARGILERLGARRIAALLPDEPEPRAGVRRLAG
ncbi:ATP-binding protein [Catenuloplanes sp. NPDC051500]|uniref:ATP-binding protein n=1 Tax=Catenuloplanes sp. NPDC051500 TaxID=3363959 RepID=UPI0037BB4E11